MDAHGVPAQRAVRDYHGIAKAIRNVGAIGGLPVLKAIVRASVDRVARGVAILYVHAVQSIASRSVDYADAS